MIFSEASIYYATDLACEISEHALSHAGISHKVTEKDGIVIDNISILTKEAEEFIGRRMGRYITVHIGECTTESQTESAIISDQLKDMISECIPVKADSPKVLIVGLGNRAITPDSLGPETADKLAATNHLSSLLTNLADGCARTCVIHPGTTAQSGIDSARLTAAVANEIKADLVIAIDALSARSPKRLLSTVQISDSGIRPGSGVGGRATEISHATLGIPVISIGVPTVVSSSAIVYEALSKAGVSEISDELKSVLENGRNYLVSPKNVDIRIKELSHILADSINMALIPKSFLEA